MTSQILAINNCFTQNTCLLIRINVNETDGTGHVYLFTYGNWLLITCGFSFNIHDLFVYFFKVMSTTASQITTCFYLLMEIGYWLHVVFLLIFMIYLFTSSQRSQQEQRKSPPVFIYLWKLVIDCMWFSFSYSWSICLLLHSEVNNSSASHHLFLFTYGNWLFITCGFRFNIYDLIVYLLKAMSTTGAQVNTCFYLLMQIACLLHVIFVVILSIYLFIYWKQCQQQQIEETICFYLLMQIVSS